MWPLFVDAVAAAGTRVDVYGHSHGGIVAFGAATLTSQIRRLVLYEGWPVPDPLVYALPADVDERMDELLARGDRDGVVEAALSSSTSRATRGHDVEVGERSQPRTSDGDCAAQEPMAGGRLVEPEHRLPQMLAPRPGRSRHCFDRWRTCPTRT